MTSAHTNKKVPLSYPAWLAMADSSNLDLDAPGCNIFKGSRLYSQACNTCLLPWISEASFKIPQGNTLDVGLPRTADGPRSYSEAQESTQRLGGVDMPKELIADLISMPALSNKHVLNIVNLTPWEGALELSTFGLQKSLSSCPKLRVLSLSPNPALINFASSFVADYLMEASFAF
jgi:hypothetical protein